MPNSLISVFVSTPATEPVEAPHPNTGVYVTGTQAATGGPWAVRHDNVTKTATPLTMVGRLKNYPAVTVSVVATGGPNGNGNIFNAIPAAPAGLSATGTSTGINVTASTSPNGLANRILASDTATGTFLQIYQGTASQYPHPVAAGATKYYRYQYVGAGFFDDSPLSVVFQATATAGATGKFLYIAVGDSITFGYGTTATATTPATYPNGYVPAALTRLGNPASVTLRLRGFSGQTYQWYQTNELANDLAFIDANLSLYDAVIVTLAFGANDLTKQYPAQDQGPAGAYSHQQAVANAYRAKGPKIKIILGAVMNRIDSYSTPTFDTDRTQFNNLMSANFPSYADAYNDPASQPTMWGSSAPGNTNYFFDQVHPNNAGAAIMAELYAAKLAPYFNLVLAPAYTGYLGSAGTSSSNLPPSSTLASYAPVSLKNSTYNASTLTLTKTSGVDHNFDAAAQIPLKFGAGRFQLHLPTANVATNAADPWQSVVVGFTNVLLDLTQTPTALYQQLQYSLYFDAQKSGVIEGNVQAPIPATLANWPAGVLPNLDIVHTEAVGATPGYFTYYRGDQPIRTVNTSLVGPFYAYLIQSTNNGSSITNITCSGDALTPYAVPVTATPGAAAAGGAIGYSNVVGATFASNVLTGTSTVDFAAYANASTKINTAAGAVDITFPTASRAGGAFVSLFAAPVTATTGQVYQSQLVGLYMNTDGTVNGFTGPTGGTAVAGAGQTARMHIDSTGITMFLGAATTPFASFPAKATVYYIVANLYQSGSELKTVTLSGPGLVVA